MMLGESVGAARQTLLRRKPLRRGIVVKPRPSGLRLGQVGLNKRTFREMAKMLWRTGKGESPVPLPGVGMAGRGMQLRSIGRQQLARVPVPVKAVAAGAAGLGAAATIEVITGKSPARIAHEAVTTPFRSAPAGAPAAPRRQQVSRSLVRQHPSQHLVVRAWQTFPGGPVFQRFSDGHIEVQRKDGTIKTFRPYRPVVIPRKWNARSMSRVATALKRQRKTATKILQITGGLPKRTVRVQSTGTHRSVDV